MLLVMKKILCKVEYLGEDFFGWQVQNIKNKTVRTVENEIVKVLEKVLKEKVSLFVSGRTDGGVSAKGQYFHFETSSNIEPKKLLIALKSLLPKDISVTKAVYVDSDFDARYSAKEKEYHYMCYIDDFVDTFLEKQYLRLGSQIDIKKMRKAVKPFKGMNNFEAYYKKTKNTNYDMAVFKQKKNEILKDNSLTKNEKEKLLKIARKKHTTLRKITSFKIEKQGKKLIFKIRGDGFLHNMVRIIVGTIIEVGQGKRTLEEVKQSLNGKSREYAGKTIEAKGLVLWDVFYWVF